MRKFIFCQQMTDQVQLNL